MIITVTLNPALDKLLPFSSFEVGTFNKADRPITLPGGKAVNMAVILNRLGHDALALGLVGGFVGKFIEDTLESQKIYVGLTHIREDTRTNSILIEPNGRTTQVAEAGPIVSPEEIDIFLSSYERSLSGGNIVIVAGSLPPGIPTNIYKEIISTAKNKNISTVLNARGLPFAAGAEAGPTIAKPDVRLLPEVLNTSGNTLLGRRKLAEHLFGLGSEIVIIAVDRVNHEIYTQTQAYEATAPGHPPANTIIAGDAFLAGFVDARSRGCPIDEASIWAMAAELAVGREPEKRWATADEIQALCRLVSLRVIE